VCAWKIGIRESGIAAGRSSIGENASEREDIIIARIKADSSLAPNNKFKDLVTIHTCVS